MVTKYTSLDRRRRLNHSRFNEHDDLRVLPLERHVKWTYPTVAAHGPGS